MRMNKEYQMGKEWDEIALINPYYCIDSSYEFESNEVDEQKFWKKRKELATLFLKDLQIGNTSAL